MEEAWMKFTATGSVTDYLRFKGIETENISAEEKADRKPGKKQNGTEYCSDRNGFKHNAGWGL